MFVCLLQDCMFLSIDGFNAWIASLPDSLAPSNKQTDANNTKTLQNLTSLVRTLANHATSVHSKMQIRFAAIQSKHAHVQSVVGLVATASLGHGLSNADLVQRLSDVRQFIQATLDLITQCDGTLSSIQQTADQCRYEEVRLANQAKDILARFAGVASKQLEAVRC